MCVSTWDQSGALHVLTTHRKLIVQGRKKKEAEDIFARREIIVYLMAHFTTQEA